MVAVIIEESPECPYCRALRKLVEPICRALNVPFIERFVVDVEPLPTETDITLTKEWLEEFGGREGKRLNELLEKTGLRRMFTKGTPNLIIEYYAGGTPKQIVIRGFSGKKAEEFRLNLIKLLLTLKEVEKDWRRRIGKT